MHDYLRAIGFSSIHTKAEIENILQDVEINPDKDFITDDGIMPVLGEKSKEFAKDIGIIVRGEYDQEGDFIRDYYFPYFKSQQVTMRENISVEKHSDRISYVGICDNLNVGVSMIFHLLNMIDYVERSYSVENDEADKDICLSALSISGKILLPLLKTEDSIKQEEIYTNNRNSKISAARNGDQEAIEKLTLEDLDLFTMAVKRTRSEDLLSIVETYFMPYGISCDQYSILGTILDADMVINKLTKEQVYILKIECNSLIFDVCINASDLMGEPVAGRRFKGNIWIQGSIDYNGCE